MRRRASGFETRRLHNFKARNEPLDPISLPPWSETRKESKTRKNSKTRKTLACRKEAFS